MRKLTLSLIFLLATLPYGFLCCSVDAFVTDRPNLNILANCGKLTDFYISQEGWQVSKFSSCLRTQYGGTYIFSSAVKANQSIVWTSEGGNKWRDYSVISTNLSTRDYVQYKAGLGINGKGNILSMRIEEWKGMDVIPIRDILTVLEWERELYKPSSTFRNDKCNAAIKSANEQIEVGRKIELSSYIDSVTIRRPNYLENRPLRLKFSLRGDFAKDLVRSDKLLSSLSSSIINSCPFISMVDFGAQNSDNISTYGLFQDGQTKLFQCIGVRRSENGKPVEETPWGYFGCFFKK